MTGESKRRRFALAADYLKRKDVGFRRVIRGNGNNANLPTGHNGRETAKTGGGQIEGIERPLASLGHDEPERHQQCAANQQPW
jgi:hypothetical protein